MRIYRRRMNRILKYFLHILYLVFATYVINQRSYKTTSLLKLNRFVIDMKHVLLWNKIEGIPDNGQVNFIKGNCDYMNCFVTSNRSLFKDIRYFDAVLFNAKDASWNNIKLPEVRSLNQKYIFVARDSADNFPICDPVYEAFFNWTWTFRTDSTIVYRFISYYNKDHEELGTHFEWNREIYNSKISPVIKSTLSMKSIAAAIFLDECSSSSKREVYIESLKIELAVYGLTMDIFGQCGITCKRRNMAPCYWRLSKNYYFYLAFEDSISYDYVTAIVLHAYNHNTVPIVYGGANYDRFLPPGSYINAMDHNTSSLAKTIQNIINNKDGLYYDFFKWRNFYTIREGKILEPCTFCEHLNRRSWLMHRVTYINFRKWWNGQYYHEKCGLL